MTRALGPLLLVALVNAVFLAAPTASGQCQYCPLCPVPGATANPPTVCSGDVVELGAGPAIGPCSWTPADAVDDPTSCLTTARPSQSTAYTVTFVAAFWQCVVTAYASVSVPVSPPPIITAPASAVPGEAGLSASVPLHVQGIYQSSYRWSIANGEITSGQDTNVITFAVAPHPVRTDGGTFVEISAIETPPGACPSEKATASVAVTGSPMRKPRVLPFR